jgi:membrane peptidoglycan carboxypeptidase
MKRRVVLGVLAAIGAAVAVPCGVVWRGWMADGDALARSHTALQAPHPGWSFPSRVVAYAPDEMTTSRAVAEAKARGYTENCKAPAPGTFCARNSEQPVVFRDGVGLEPVQLGVLIGEHGELRTHLPLKDAPQVLVDAILAGEDREFYEHSGVNFTALIRAALKNTRDGGYTQGASTLTMQVVRAMNQRSEKTVKRKLREAAEAMGVENAIGKEGVLQMYLDAPYLGQRGSLSVSGFAEAARHYFGVDVKDITLVQAATLAAVLPGPGRYAPDKHPEACRVRRDRILKALGEHYGYDVTAALAEPVVVVKPAPLPEDRYPAYLHAVRAELERRFAKEVVYGAGLVVEVGIDVPMQAEAEAMFADKTEMFEQFVGRRGDEALQAVGVSLDPNTGVFKAIYGGHDVTSTGFNRATQSRRQPGSSFKPVVYALAFAAENNDGTPKFTAASIEPNAPRVFKTAQGDWRPRNVGGEATVTAALAQGLAWSQNIATASLLEELGGAAPLIAFANTLGFDTRAYPPELGLALGQAEVTPVEMAQFVGTVANGGLKIEASTLVRVVDAAGAVRFTQTAPTTRVLTPAAAALTRDLMRLVIEMGTGGASRGAGGEGGYNGPAMGKTGTTDSEKDLWFVGATPKLATVVWLGYDDPVRIGAAAADFAAPLWGWWMGRTARIDGEPLPDFPKEPKLTKVDICTISGKRPNATCKAITAPFLPGTAPKGVCSHEHVPEEEGEGEKHESIWKRRAREAAEAEAGVVPAVP